MLKWMKSLLSFRNAATKEATEKFLMMEETMILSQFISRCSDRSPASEDILLRVGLGCRVAKWLKRAFLPSFRNFASASKEYLIVGLGNPGKAYEKTRHNVGFRAARYFAKRHAIALRQAQRMSAETGTGRVGATTIGVLLPMTYMNSSGEAVLHAMKAFKVPSERVAVIVDDIAFPVGEIRFKEEGSHGGHNGLRSIEEHLGSRDFSRLRIGVGHPGGADLADFVLSPFEKGEETQLPDVFNHVADVLDCWILQGTQKAMTLANTKKN